MQLTNDMRPSVILRELAKRGQYGHSRSPRNFYIREGSFYKQMSWAYDISQAAFDKAARLSERYRRFANYVEEVAPQWETVNRLHYADNSIEAVQRDRHGNERRVMEVGPSGDACY